MIGGESDARQWLETGLHVSRETMERLDTFATLVRSENAQQNLVSPASLGAIWTRHIADSAQLLRHAVAGSSWLDIGSGAGFPGMIVALLHDGPATLVEPRKLRAEFLFRAVALLGVQPTIIATKLQHLPIQRFDTISARAVAPLPELLSLAFPFSTENTRLIFPKGRNAQSELEAARRAWQGEFRSEPSLTDPEARIVIVEGLRRRPGKVT